MGALTVSVPEEFVEAVAERAAEIVLERLGAERPPTTGPYVSVREAAEILRVSPRTVERMIARGRVRSTTLGRRRLLHRCDLDALVGAATGEGTAPTAPSRRRGG